MSRGWNGFWNGWDYFGDNKANQYKNYYVRFRVAFPNQEDFVNCFPDTLQKVAIEYYPILSMALPNLLLDSMTVSNARGRLMLMSRRFMGDYVRRTQLQELTLNDFFSNDIIETLNSTVNSNLKTNNSSEQNSNDNSKSTNYDTNNEYNGDSSTFDDSQWKADKYLQGGSNGDNTSNSTSTDTTDQTQDSTTDNRRESKNTKYDANQILTLIGLGVDPNANLIYKIINAIKAPIQLDFEELDDWRGDFK